MSFRPWPKLCFCRFLFFGRGRNAFFFIFQLSAAAATLFLLFFTRRPRPKTDFYRFLAFGHGRRANYQSRGLLGGP